ncbi:MAG: histidinol-phosphatase [Alphaproteobacteria bacterium]|nr:MAG: histidinol-phosphatase [Alphaproteobacteria bacterium]
MSRPFRNPNPVLLADIELKELAEFAGRLADASRKAILPHFRENPHMENKRTEEDYDPVTVADREAEESIRSLIEKYYPEHSIFGEEFGYKEGESALTWTLDPIDGTRPFLLGLPTWGTLIALHNGSKPILGILDQPFTGERFIGAPQIGIAELQTSDQTISLETRDCPALSEASLSSTHPSMFKDAPLRAAYDELASKTRIHVYGGDCYAYGTLSLGLHDIVVEASLAPYDIQAMIPIIEAAGGIVTDWNGGPADLGGQVLAAGTRDLHTEALEILRPAAQKPKTE